MQQGQADILIATFPDPSYGVKTINFIKKTPLTYRELPRRFLIASLEDSFSSLLVDSTQASTVPKRRRLNMDFQKQS